jgi:hypothetical protein
VTGPLVYEESDAAAAEGVRNSQPEGIGRMVTLDGLVCWNNLGRNVVFADDRLQRWAVFGTTIFPGEDEPSQYDLDVHAILEVPEQQQIIVLNHYGVVRVFRRAEILGQAAGRLIQPVALWWFVADVERAVVVAGRLVGSAPRSEGAIGLVVSTALDAATNGGRISTRRSATEFGEVTALAVGAGPEGPIMVLGGEGRAALVPFAGGRVGSPRWEASLGFRVAVLVWHTGLLWAAGPPCGSAVDDYDWERMSGGGFAALNPVDGRTIVSGPLPADVAWGTGGVAVAPFGQGLAAVGRTGCVHLVDPGGDGGVRSTPAMAGRSLGIAHLAAGPGALYCGFNRGGYRLHAFRSPVGTPLIGRA